METGPQTGWTLEELVQSYESGGGEYCLGMILDDIGVMALHGNKDAEAFLKKLLTSEDWRARLLSFCFLSEVTDKTPDITMALADFGKDPVNEELMAQAREMLSKKRFGCC